MLHDLILIPVHETIGVYLNFSVDDDAILAIVEYRQAGTELWQRGVDMRVDRRTMVTQCDYSPPYDTVYEINFFPNQWRGIVFGLKPKTYYEVRVTCFYPDNTMNSLNELTQTLDDNPPSLGTPLWVSLQGNDANDGLSSDPIHAWRTIARAMDAPLGHGDQILLMPGGYAGPGNAHSMARPGAPGNFNVLRSADLLNRASILPGTERINITASYWRIKGIIGNGGDGNCQDMTIREGVHDLIIEECDLAVADSADYTGGGPTCAICLFYPNWNILVQKNYIHPLTSVSLERHAISDKTTSADPVATTVDKYSFAITFRDNDIDGMWGLQDGYNGHWYKDTFFIREKLRHFNDDPIEFEGDLINCAALDNDIHDSKMGNGLCPAKVGPAWIVNAKHATFFDTGLKLGNSSQGFVHVYHTTIYCSAGFPGVGCFGNNQKVNNMDFRNCNTFVGGYVINQSDEGPGWGGWHMDYNNWKSMRSSAIAKWKVPSTAAQNTFDELRAALRATPLASGYEEHGMSVDPMLVDPENGDLSLKPESPLRGKGVIIPGINNKGAPWYHGDAPDIGVVVPKEGNGGETAMVTFKGSLVEKTTGKLMPGKVVTIGVTKPDASIETFEVTTDAESKFLTTREYVPGSYSGMAGFAGDDAHNPGVTEPKPFVVGKLDVTLSLDITVG